MALVKWDYLMHDLVVPSPNYWNLASTFDLTKYQSMEPSRKNIVANLPPSNAADSILTNIQKRYLLDTASRIENKDQSL